MFGFLAALLYIPVPAMSPARGQVTTRKMKYYGKGDLRGKGRRKEQGKKKGKEGERDRKER